MKKHWELVLGVAALIVGIVALVAGIWYGHYQGSLARRAEQAQAESLVREATEMVTRGRMTMAQTDWRLTGDDEANVQKALSRLDLAIRMDGANIEALKTQALCNDILGRYDESLRGYERALALSPSKSLAATILNNMGNVYLEQCEVAKAGQHFRKAIASYPQLAVAHGNLADVLRRQKKYQDAIGEARIAGKLAPDFVGALLVEARVEVARGNLQTAYSVLIKAVRIDPKYQVDTHLDLSHLLDRMGRSEDALKEARAAVLIEPNSAVSHEWLAELLRKAGNTKEADTEMEAAQTLASLRKSSDKC
ncbi:MAG TPA: tetratricopeptide repeat protein [Thermoanaerobaculia bacterium]|nr:tetratricopeptide repeat protein [Thermoanaerobaculia bacterium]